MCDADQLASTLAVVLPEEARDPELCDHGVGKEPRDGDDRAEFEIGNDSRDDAIERGRRQ